ncbi:type IV fimbrial biogenesis protein PilV [Aquitalea magnusonii]|jgi:type IV pilus assembly protein PilV|uniref:Type IV fimbrial biogenesis protein PilV n=1 Tax=Aquitalea magnusonii TaxID=332411 RepID=A0A3G9GFC1_9NEIS|nr:type IV pilus modification protein PilV [Aquitalea magnusonii]BBF86580.1 type IV fimbrial biogenesis protein PilV [Aquitalea magnusonii]
MNKTSGFTMLEVLVSILIVGVGMLAIAGMQGRTLKTVREAETQAVAAMLAGEVADAMRANASATINASGSVTEDWSNYVETSYSDHSSAPITLCAAASATACTSAQMAAYDLYQFKSSLASAFVDSNRSSVRAIVCRDSTASSTINFDDSKLGGCTGGSKLMIRVAWKAAMEKNANAALGSNAANRAASATSSTRVYGYVLQFEP